MSDLSKDDKCALQIFKLVTDQTERIARLIRQCDALHKSYNLMRAERDKAIMERDEARALGRCA